MIKKGSQPKYVLDKYVIHIKAHRTESVRLEWNVPLSADFGVEYKKCSDIKAYL